VGYPIRVRIGRILHCRVKARIKKLSDKEGGKNGFHPVKAETLGRFGSDYIWSGFWETFELFQ